MIGFTSLKRILLATATLGFAAHAAAASTLTLDVYNPGDKAIFPVTSVLVSGEKDAILVDAQFGKSQAEQVVEKIRASGKQLTTIYISHGDPDYYFGLDTLTAAFPNAKVLASQPTVDHIQKTVDGKLAFWGPKMGTDVPAKTIVPDVLKGDSLMLEGQKLQVVGSGRQATGSHLCLDSVDQGRGRWRRRRGKHPRVDGRHPDAAVPRRLADYAARHRNPETENHRAGSLPR